MRRRDLIAVGTLALAAAPAMAAESKKPTSGGSARNISGVALPIITDGRIRNYVFVTVRLQLGDSQTPELMRAQEPYYRDALVRAAHRTPFVIADDWTRVDEVAISAFMMRVAPTISGAGAITAAEVAIQTPRRRMSLRQG